LSPRLYDNKLEGEKGIGKDELKKLVLEYYKIRVWNAKGIPQKSKQTIKAKQTIKETEPK